MSWSNTPSRGWPVGVGASSSYGPSYGDDEEERLRQEYQIDPVRRWNQLAEERDRDPAAGWLHTAMVPFEALGTAAKYGLGVTQGLVQRDLETGASVWATLNGQTVPDRLPRELRVMGHPMGDEPTKLVPESRGLLDTLNPGTALARYDALTPEPVQPVLEGMATWGIGALGKLPEYLKWGEGAQKALRPGQGVWEAVKNTELLGPAAANPNSPLAQAAAALVSPQAKTAATYGTPLVGGAVMALTAPEDTDPWARATRAAEGVMGGLAVGAAVVGAQNYLQRSARITGKFEVPDLNPNNIPLTPLGQRMMVREGEAPKYEGQPTPRQGHPKMTNYDPDVDYPAMYPKGTAVNASANLSLAQFRASVWDRNAVLGDLMDAIRIQAEESKIPFTEAMDIMGQVKVLHGSVQKAEHWIERQVPASALGTQVSVTGAKGVLYDNGIRTAEQLDHFERMHTVQVAMERSAQATPLATGHLGIDPAAQAAHFQELKTLADQRWPGLKLGDKMEQAGRDMSQFYDAVLDYYTDHGQMLKTEIRDESKARYQTYGHIKSIDDEYDTFTKKPERPTEPLTPTASKVEEAFSELDPNKELRIDTTDNMSRAVKMIQLADMNNLAIKMDDLAQVFPDTWGSHWRPLEKAQTYVEKGWEQVRFRRNGEDQFVLTTKPIGDLLRGINVEAADAVTGTMAKIGNTFRKGVTVWSPQFIMSNITRDLHNAMINTNMPVDIIREFPGALSSMFAHNIDDWYRYNQDNPLVKALPQKAWDGFRDHVLKPWGGAQTGLVDEAIEQGIGMTTMSGVIRGQKTPESLLGIKPQLNDPLAPLATLIRGPAEFMETLSGISEMSTRMAVYRAEMGKVGATPFSAAIATREATVDFSKAGNMTRVANLWLPLLNARMQGELRTFRAARDDPAGFVGRETMLTGIPAVMSYAWNRTMFPDLYEMIPSEERMRNHILVYGSMTDDNDRVKPIYLRIPKDQISAALTVPLEHVMDTVYHTRYYAPQPAGAPRDQAPTTGGHPLDENARTQAPTSWMLMRTLGSLLPTDMYPNELTSPISWITSALTMNPVWNVGQGIQSNQDPFRRQPIVPEEQMVLPPEYRYGPQTPSGYKALSHVATKLFEGMGVDTTNLNWLSPSVMQFAARGLGASAPDYLLSQMDIAMPKLQEIGLVPPGAFVPATLSDLRLPPGTPIEVQSQYLSQLESPDARPAYARIFSRFVGASARSGSMTERASHLGQREQDQAKATQDFNRAYQKFLVEWRKEVAELDAAPDITHQAKLDGMQRLGKGRAQAYKALEIEHPLAITDQKELREFQDRLPGVGTEWMQDELPKLPDGWSGQKIAEYLMAPPGVDMAKLSVTDRYKAQRRGLNVLSQQLGQPVNVLEMYAGVHKLGTEVPGVAVPNLAIEQGLNAYLNPTDAKGVELDPLTTPAHLMQRAREAALQTVSATWGVPPDMVKATMDARLNNPMELNADGVSRMRATMLWQRLNDPYRFPTYVNPDGSALGDEAQWAQWDADLAKARVQYHDRLPPQYARLEAAKKFGEMRQLQALATHDQQALGPLPAVAIADHERWYGIGRAMTSQQWAEYQSGKLPRYKEGGPSEWAQWDMMQKMYAATPPGPTKDRMRNQVRRVRALQTPGWRSIVQKDQLIREDALWDEMQQPD